VNTFQTSPYIRTVLAW